MDLCESNGNILYILNVLKKYSDENNMLKISDIIEKVEEEYNQKLDSRTIRRNINLLKIKFNYDISTYSENNKGYYIINNSETDFEPSEVRKIINTFYCSNYSGDDIEKNIIKKFKRIQSPNENEKLKDYKVYLPKEKGGNIDVAKNIENISNSILNKNKIKFDYWKYCIEGDKIGRKIISKSIVLPLAILYDKNIFYFVGTKEEENELFHYRLDRMKNISILNEKYESKITEKQIEQYAENSIETFSNKETEIVADCHESLLGEVFEKYGQKIKIKPINKSKFRIKINGNKSEFKIWVLKNIDMCTVVKPIKLKNEIKEILEEAEKRYK